MFLKIKQHLKRFTALALSFMTVLNTPMASFAIGGNTSSGDASAIAGGIGSDLGVNRPNSRIGFRVSIVSKENPSEVISVDDNGNKTVLDFLFTSEDRFQYYTGMTTKGDSIGKTGYRTNMTYIGSGSRLQAWNEPNLVRILPEEEYIPGDMGLPEVPQWCKSTGNMLYGGNGTPFEEWFTSDPDGNTQVGGASGDLFSTSGGVVKQKVGTRLDVTTSYKDTDGNDISFSITVPAFNTSAGVQNWIKEYTNNWGPGVDNFAKTKMGISDWESLSTADKAALYISYTETVKSALHDAAKSNAVLRNSLSTIDAELDSALKKAQDNINFNNKKLSKAIDKINPFRSLNVYAAEDITESKVAEGSTNLGGEYIGVTITDVYKELPSNAKIKLLLTMKSSTTTGYLFQTDSTIDKHNKEGKDVDITEATEDWLCFVEPIFFCSLFPVGDDSRVLCEKFYGTLTNFYDWVHSTHAAGHLTDKALDTVRSTMNWKFYNSAGSYGSIKLNKDVSNTAGQVCLNAPTGSELGATATFNQLYNVLVAGKVGYAVHAYDKNSMSESSTTTTWDYMNHPTDVGPSPDEKEQKEDNWDFSKQNGENLAKKFIISKFYYLKSPWGDLTLTDVQTREETLHSVLITDEGTKDSEYAYRVKGWAAGKDKIYPQTDDLSEGFKEYVKKNRPADPQHQGNGQDMLTLDPNKETDKQEQVLYVMLVREEIINQNVDIVRVYERNDGTSEVETELGVDVDKSLDGSSKKTGFDFDESKNTPSVKKDVKNWDEVKPLEGDTGNNPTIPVKETDRTIYIKYHESESPEIPTGTPGLVLHENELSYQYQLENVDGSLHNTDRKYRAANEPSDETDYCGGCEEDDDDDWYCPGHPCSPIFEGTTDYSFGLFNEIDYSTEKVWKC